MHLFIKTLHFCFTAFCSPAHSSSPLKMGCISVIGAFAFLLLSCAAANRQAHLRNQREKDVFVDDPLIGIDGNLKITTLEPGKVEGELMMVAGEFISSAR